MREQPGRLPRRFVWILLGCIGKDKTNLRVPSQPATRCADSLGIDTAENLDGAQEEVAFALPKGLT